MTIKDYAGNKLTKPEEWQKPTGRLIQSKDEVDTLIFATWDEVPDTDEEGNVIDHSEKPSTEERLSATESALIDLMTQ